MSLESESIALPWWDSNRKLNLSKCGKPQRRNTGFVDNPSRGAKLPDCLKPAAGSGSSNRQRPAQSDSASLENVCDPLDGLYAERISTDILKREEESNRATGQHLPKEQNTGEQTYER